MVNYAQDFTIDLASAWATEGETADSYTIDLMNGDETIGTYEVEAMVPWATSKSYTCSWTPHTLPAKPTSMP